MFISILFPLSVLSHSVESCGTCLTRPGIVFHRALILSQYINYAPLRPRHLNLSSVKQKILALVFIPSFLQHFHRVCIRAGNRWIIVHHID